MSRGSLCLADNCVPRYYGYSSFVCVCNSTYCDTMDASPQRSLVGGSYHHFVSTKDGLRFDSTVANFTRKPKIYFSIKRQTLGQTDEMSNAFVKTEPRFSQLTTGLISETANFIVRRDKPRQEIYGFGGAMTDASGINIASLSANAQDNLLKSYFAPTGIEYTFIRVPIAGSDFSNREYSYDDVNGDTSLVHFGLAEEDYQYKVFTMDNEGKQLCQQGSYCVEMSRLSTYDSTCELEVAENLYPWREAQVYWWSVRVYSGVYQAIEELPYFSQFIPHQPNTPSLQCRDNIPKKQGGRKRRVRVTNTIRDKQMSEAAAKYDKKNCPEVNLTAVAAYSLKHPEVHRAAVIPYIKKAQALSKRKLKLFSAPWGSPKWMKKEGFIKSDYYQLWADYIIKFLDEYKKQGLHFWGLSPENEPVTPSLFGIEYPFNFVLWTPETMFKFVVEYLGPALSNNGYGDLLLMMLDDRRAFVPEWSEKLFTSELLKRFASGLAVHWYNDNMSSPDILTQFHDENPDIFILYTEACHDQPSTSGVKRPTRGKTPKAKRQRISSSSSDKDSIDIPSSVDSPSDFPDEETPPSKDDTACPFSDPGPAVQLGSWERAESYVSSIIEVLNHWVSGWVDWNLVLDIKGGPNWANNVVDSPIIVNATADEFYKQPMFYGLGHFSKFIRAGSGRIDLQYDDNGLQGLETVAAIAPDGVITIVVQNRQEEGKRATFTDPIRGVISMSVPPRSIHTIIYKG
uniref:Glucosylceramidase n=1 Tax=Timema poppense TaxID=170557 RepID=A0A7R9CLE9_TIMPO|nr:unnamed protein product [Timema poppensis]